MNILENIDIELFRFLNSTISNPISNKFFPFITDLKSWILVYLIFWLILFFKEGKKGKIVAISVLLVVTISDQVASSFLKNFFERIRPCNVLENVNLLVKCSKSFSMPSSHAVNNFAVATFLSIFYSRFKYIFFTIAILVALSRPIVGVHYPADIFVGAIVGTIIGYFAALIIKKLRLL